mgnify:CR=1|tara:strand:- start:255 stop:449 length:195 start_codon:yes stop_codon:yes gene_type:complete
MESIKTTPEIAAELFSHERECALRYEFIKIELESGSKRFDRLDKCVMGLYATIIGLSLINFISP